MIEMKEMQQQPSPNYPNEFMMTLNTISRQLERLDERTRDLPTRADLELVRKELVRKESLEPQLNDLRRRIERIDQDRIADRIAWEKRADELEKEQLSRQDRLWMRLMQGVGILGFIMALFDFLMRSKLTP